MESIAKYILSKYKEDSGIVYCTARKTCEEVCEKLNQAFRGTSLAGKVNKCVDVCKCVYIYVYVCVCVQVTYYHAGIEDIDERKRKHEEWSSDNAKVCAHTIFTF